MPVGHQFAIRRQALEGPAFQHAVITLTFQIFQDLSVEYKEAGVDPSIRLRFFREMRHPATGFNVHYSETRYRAYGGPGRQFAVGTVKLEEGGNVDIRQPVAIRQHESLGVQVACNSPQPASGHRLLPRLGETNLEVLLGMLIVKTNRIFSSEADREIVIHRLIIEEVLLDHVAPVPQTKHEVAETVMREQFHDVP